MMNSRNIKQDYVGDRQLHKYKAMELVRSELLANQTLGLPYAINVGILLMQTIKKNFKCYQGVKCIIFLHKSKVF
jgi:GTPase Era involved in 16S rRNA processing